MTPRKIIFDQTHFQVFAICMTNLDEYPMYASCFEVDNKLDLG